MSSSNDNQGSSGSDQQAPPNDDTGSKSTETGNVPSSTAHTETGAEKFVASGGSGGAAVHSDKGYEAMAHH